MRPQMDLRVTRALAATLASAVTYTAVGGIAHATPTAGGAAFVPASPLPPTLAPVATGGAASGEAASTHTHLELRRDELNVLDGHAATVAGAIVPALSRRMVLLQAQRHGRWLTVARSATGSRGRFVLRYHTRRPGSERVRLRFDGDSTDHASLRALGRLNIYRLALASWYGGGGNLACGGTLTSSTLGVANKTLPCGTLVTLRYGSRIVRVPVVDRGPYVAGREFDLTEATKRALGFEGVGAVWSTS